MMVARNRNNWLVLGAAVVALLGLAALDSLPAVKGDDKLKDLIRSTGVVEIKLIEAQVPDLDPLPMQRDSDVFARVYLNDTKEMICETQVVQDDNKPKFDKECKSTRALPSDTVLRFELYDSDKPAPEPDWIGMTRIKISDLILNRKLDSTVQFPIEGRNYPKYFIRTKVDFKPQK